jgi:hypothetical protein
MDEVSLNWVNIFQFFSMVISFLVAISALICASLYKRAYIEMKKTKIILSIAMVFYAVALKFFWTGFGYFLIFLHWELYDPYMFNATNSIPNIFLLWAIINFIHLSIKTPNQTKDCLKEIDGKDIRQI